MAYGVDPVNNFRLGAAPVAKVLCGAKPVELPAELPTKFERVINLKTARATVWLRRRANHQLR
jgi:putative ABC transport system substrate-binding protein